MYMWVWFYHGLINKIYTSQMTLTHKLYYVPVVNKIC